MAFLTRQEKYVIAFLMLGAICGLSYSYYKKFNPPIDIRSRDSFRGDTAITEEFDSLLAEAQSVNINKASVEELIKLKGIGPILAHRIIKYRRARGAFGDKEELKNIKGIGPKKFKAIKDYILIE